MGFLSDLKNKFTESKNSLLNEVSKYKNKDFMEGIVAGAVVISAADGNIDSKEKEKLFAYIKQSEELKAFSTDDIIAFFNKLTASYEFDPAIGKAEALKKIAPLRGKDAQARLLVRVAIIIANSDGDFDESEKKAVKEICAELNVPYEDF